MMAFVSASTPWLIQRFRLEPLRLALRGMRNTEQAPARQSQAPEQSRKLVLGAVVQLAVTCTPLTSLQSPRLNRSRIALCVSFLFKYSKNPNGCFLYCHRDTVYVRELAPAVEAMLLLRRPLRFLTLASLFSANGETLVSLTLFPSRRYSRKTKIPV